ncbi:MAG: hypothetical protein DWQ47_10675 [Acidobacteria bacterium]|nr:MAG: hypothetical protein DWQ32_13090 [Acidobacteriota bacterium]REJ98049.1 MAG: hypothetical protein DWQ38_15890 [Acidobacteriota bacterium]REK16792.1 MAG: hypothetical protein DWQ43_00935 [Acidobacteriota bacterium]REK42703.1 MAG: hypothetical protein DWQ47_10675 [Acidobacteriota bacterium]
MHRSPENTERQTEGVAAMLSKAARPLFFTGAGISTGSGIPDFRGPKGIWKSRKPVYYQEFLASETARIEHWDYKLEGFEQFRNAKPNKAHFALAELEGLGRLDSLVTQNIDGLHEQAGNSSVIELHGTNRWVECVECGNRTEPEPAFREFRETRACPRCECGGYLKTATISFGQQMPERLLEQAFEAAEKADLVVAIGSTLEVHPAASVPLAAARKGVPYVIINRGPTAQDRQASVRIEGDVNVLIPEIVERLKKILRE